MVRSLVVVAAGMLTGCTATTAPRSGPDFTPSYSRIAVPNTAPRGSEAFCRTYGRQSSTNRAFSSAPAGKGPRGCDRTLAQVEGERAYQRCLAGRTN